MPQKLLTKSIGLTFGSKCSTISIDIIKSIISYYNISHAIIENEYEYSTGTCLGNVKVNIIMYADDILVITDSKKQMQKALDIVTQYGELNFIKFNAEKT